MAKRRTTAAKRARRVSFKAYLRESSVAPVVDRDVIAQDWVWHGMDNLYPVHLRKLVDNCGPLERSITQLSEFVAGTGITFVDRDGKTIDGAQEVFQEWVSEMGEEAFLARCGYDVSHGLGLTLTVRRAFGGEIARVDHSPRMVWRMGKTREGYAPVMYRSGDWAKALSDVEYKPEGVELFDITGKMRTEEGVIFERQYHPLEPVYGRLFWMGAMRAAEVWVKVDNYNRTQIDTGFTPSVIIGTRFEGTEEEVAKHEDDVNLTMTGSGGKGAVVFTMGAGEGEPFFRELSRGNHAGELDQIGNRCADVIYDTFGIPSLLMRDREGGLTSQERAIAIRLQQLQRTVVARKQRMITAPLVKLMNLSGVPVWDARISPLQIFDPVQSEKVMLLSRSVNEVRADAGLEARPDGEQILAEVARNGDGNVDIQAP